MKMYFPSMLERVLILNADPASKSFISLFKSKKNKNFIVIEIIIFYENQL